MCAKKAVYMPRDDDVDVYIPDINDNDDVGITEAEKATQSAIDSLSSCIEKGYTTRIYRQRGSGKEAMEFVMSEPSDKRSIDELQDYLRDTYGGGDYRFMIYNERAKLAANKLITIATPVKNSVDGGGGINSIISQLIAGQERLYEKITSISNGNNSSNSREDMLREMLLYKELFSQNSDPAVMMKSSLETMSLMHQMINANNTTQHTDNDSDGFTKLIGESLPLFTEIVKTQSQQRAPDHMKQRARQRRTHSKNTVVNTAVVELLKLKNTGTEAADAAELMLDKVAMYPGGSSAIEKFVTRDDVKSHILNSVPQSAPHIDWLIDVVEWTKGFLGHKSKFDSEFTVDDNVQTDNVDTDICNENKIDTDGDTAG